MQSLGWSLEQRPGWVVGQYDGADVDKALVEQRTAIRFCLAA